MICIIHKWKTVYQNPEHSGQEVRQCKRCGKYEHLAYDGKGIGWYNGVGYAVDIIFKDTYQNQIINMEKLLKEGKTFPEIADILIEVEPKNLTTIYYMCLHNIEKGVV